MTQLWSPNQINSNLSGGGTTTVTDTGSDGVFSPAFGSEGVSIGKYYWEGRITASVSANYVLGDMGFGIGNTSSSTAAGQWLGVGFDTLGVYPVTSGTQVALDVGGGRITTITLGFTIANGDLFGFALDLDNNGFAFNDITANSGWVGSATGADPSTNTSMFSLTQASFTIINHPVVPGVSLFNSTSGGDVGVGFFKKSSWTGTAPSGFGEFNAILVCQRTLLGIGCGIWVAKKLAENPVLTRRRLILPNKSRVGLRMA